MIGQSFHGRLSSADASAGVTIPLFNADGSSRTVAATETVTITDIIVSTSAALSVTLGFGNLAAGLIVAKVVTTSTSLTYILNFVTGFVGPRTVAPLIQSSAAGQVDVQIIGTLS